MYTVTKRLNPDKGYSCCFRQHRAKSHCSKLHGYDLRIVLVFGCNSSARTQDEGWVIDFGGFADVKEWLDYMFDHTCVVAADDPSLDTFRAMHEAGAIDLRVMKAVGCEAFAKDVYDFVSAWLRTTVKRDVHLLEVEIEEHGGNAASYMPGSVDA